MWHVAFLRRFFMHKLFVIREGLELGVPWAQLLTHDLSKLSPEEYLPSVRFEQSARSLTPNEMYESCIALELHRQRNAHHPEHWMRRDESGELRPTPMPDPYRREMLADWRAVGRVMSTSTRAWYLERFDRTRLHPETRAWVERELDIP